MKLKNKDERARELKAEIIRRHGTITSFAKHIGRSPATVYSALKFRRNGRVAKLIREGVGA